MHRFSKYLPIAVFAPLLVSVCLAQQTSTTSVPNLIRYGGTLKDGQGGAIRSATVGVTFAIYQRQDGGAAIWLETQNVTTDAAGNYSVLLGSTTATGLPSDLFSQQEQRWLGVQMQGQAEQPRVLLVSVPYAFKAHEAETLAGKSISDFVLVKDSNSASAASGANSPSQPGFSAGDSSAKEESGKLAASQGPTNFSGSTTDQIVGVTQTGTGVALSASAASSTGILGVANSSSGAGVLGRSDAAGGTGIYGYAGSTTGASVGLSGGAASSQGTAIYALESATNGGTVGLEARVQSPAGVAALIENLGGGMLISTMTSTGTPFTVDGLGNVHAAGMFTGSGAGLTSLNASNLSSGTLPSARLSGTYSNALTLSSTSNVFYGDGSHLMGVMSQPGPGSTFYIQNGTTQQASANFNISGNGTLGGTLAAKTLNASNPYQIGGSTVLSTVGTDNAFLGLGAGASNSSGSDDTFSGNKAGFTNRTGQWNSFYGSSAGRLNTSGNKNTFSGYAAGYSNSSASNNTSIGYKAGYSSTSGDDNTFLGWAAGYSNTTGANNTFLGLSAGYNNTTGGHNIYIANRGPASGTESSAIRIGDPAVQTTAYIAGIYNAQASSGLPVFVNANGQLGTSGSGTGIVTSFNGRMNAVVPQTGDYSFPMIRNTLGATQLSGTYSSQVNLSNSSNVFTGSGRGLTGIQFSQLSGTLGNAQLSGAYNQALNLLNSSNIYSGSNIKVSGATTDQIVHITQTGTGAGVNASAGTTAIAATATATSGETFGVKAIALGPDGIGVLGNADASTGATVGVKGGSVSTSGTGVRGLDTATTGNTTGISAYVASPAGTAGVFNNAAGGKILIGQNNGAEKFSVDGSGNVNSHGTFTGNGAGLTGIQFSQLSGTLSNSQFIGTYGNPVTLSNSSNVFYGDGSHLSGITSQPGPGSPYYIQNGTARQASANFNIDGSGTVGGTLAGNAVNTVTNYQIGGSNVLSIGSPADQNVFLGSGAGTNNVAGSGQGNTFSGNQAGYSNTDGSLNTFSGYQAGYSNTTGAENSFSGSQTGYSNTTGYLNTFTGTSAGLYNSAGALNTFTGAAAGPFNTTGSENTFTGNEAGYSNTTGTGNTFSGEAAGFNNVTGSNNTFYGIGAGNHNTTGSLNVYIVNQGPSSGTENNTIRIGDPCCQSVAYITGIYGSTVDSNGVPVYIDDNGQLGTFVSGFRVGEHVQDMGDRTSDLMKLRPVTFFYKPEYAKGAHRLQYGLIAEEVADVYPELVANDLDGKPYTVRYQYLATMLLNEVQKQHTVVTSQQEVIKTQQKQLSAQQEKLQAQQRQIESLQNQNSDFQQRLSRLESLIGEQVQTANDQSLHAATAGGQAQ